MSLLLLLPRTITLGYASISKVILFKVTIFSIWILHLNSRKVLKSRTLKLNIHLIYAILISIRLVTDWLCYETVHVNIWDISGVFLLIANGLDGVQVFLICQISQNYWSLWRFHFIFLKQELSAQIAKRTLGPYVIITSLILSRYYILCFTCYNES